MEVVVSLCVQYEAHFCPNMSIIVEALQLLWFARFVFQPGGYHVLSFLFLEFHTLFYILCLLVSLAIC